MPGLDFRFETLRQSEGKGSQLHVDPCCEFHGFEQSLCPSQWLLANKVTRTAGAQLRSLHARLRSWQHTQGASLCGSLFWVAHFKLYHWGQVITCSPRHLPRRASFINFQEWGQRGEPGEQNQPCVSIGQIPLPFPTCESKKLLSPRK